MIHEDFIKHRNTVEKLILSIFIRDSMVFVQAMVSGLKPEEFGSLENSAIYAIMIKLDQENRQPSAVAISQELPGYTNRLEQIARIEFTEYGYGSDGIKGYIKELRAINYQIDKLDQSLKLYDRLCERKPYEQDLELQKYLLDFADKLASNDKMEDESVDVADEVMDAVAAILGRKGMSGITTGFKALDGYIGGFQKGHLILLGARPGVGKTAIAMNMINSMPSEIIPMFFSLEMDRQELITRQLAYYSKVDQMKYLNGKLSENEKDRTFVAANDVVRRNIIVNDNSYLTVEDIVKDIRFKIRRKKIDIIFVDHHDLLFSSKKNKDRRLEVSYCAITLKNLAKELQIPIVLLAQLRRPSEAFIHKRPTKYDLKESSALEQSANVVLMLHREMDTIEEINRTMQHDEAELIVEKCRNGLTGVMKIKHDLRYNLFYEGNYNG